MFVRTFMTPKPFTISPDASLPQAISTIRKNKVRHLPVVENGKLVGIVVEKDLLSNQPSPATSLSVYEIYSLLEALRVRQIMSKPVITVTPDWPIEEAARVMVEKKISCVPVMEGDELVGIITETDVFKILVDVLGGQEAGFRLTLRMPDKVGALASLAGKVAALGGNLQAVTTYHRLEGGNRDVMVKEIGADQEALKKMLEGENLEVLDLRSSSRCQPRLVE